MSMPRENIPMVYLFRVRRASFGPAKTSLKTPGSCDHVLHIRGLGPARPIVYLSSSEEGWASEGSLGGLNPSFRRYPGPEETGGVRGRAERYPRAAAGSICGVYATRPIARPPFERLARVNKILLGFARRVRESSIVVIACANQRG